jgi:hypothetical protein
MKTFHLNLKRKWFDMILSGEKKEEYRDLSDYWKTRFMNGKINGWKTVTFSNGYAKDRSQMVVKLEKIVINPGKEEWGAEPGKIYFVLHLGELINKINC